MSRRTRRGRRRAARAGRRRRGRAGRATPVRYGRGGDRWRCASARRSGSSGPGGRSCATRSSTPRPPGFDDLWLDDHLLSDEGDWRDPKLEGWTTLAAVAAVTTRAPARPPGRPPTRSATPASPPRSRRPWTTCAAVARSWASAPAGSSASTRRSGSTSATAFGERLDRLGEAVPLIRRLLDGERVTHEGRFYAMTDAVCEPRPIQARLPILIGGSGPRKTLPLVARYADMWNAYGSPEALAAADAILREACAAAGRDEREIERTTNLNVVIRRRPRRGGGGLGGLARAPQPAAERRALDVGGSPAEVAEALRAYRDVGLRARDLRLPEPVRPRDDGPPGRAAGRARRLIGLPPGRTWIRPANARSASSRSPGATAPRRAAPPPRAPRAHAVDRRPGPRPGAGSRRPRPSTCRRPRRSDRRGRPWSPRPPRRRPRRVSSRTGSPGSSVYRPTWSQSPVSNAWRRDPRCLAEHERRLLGDADPRRVARGRGPRGPRRARRRPRPASPCDRRAGPRAREWRRRARRRRVTTLDAVDEHRQRRDRRPERQVAMPADSPRWATSGRTASARPAKR